MCLGPDLSIVSTAALDLAVYSGGGVDGMDGVRLVLEGIESGKILNPGAAFGGLLLLGDERVCRLLAPVRDTLNDEQVHQMVKCRSGFAYRTVFEFVLEWLEGCDSGHDDGRFGDLASLLYTMPLRLRYAKVLEVRRLFDGHDSVRVETISEEAIPAFARKYAARLYALEKSEKAPKVMSTVMRSWGLSPRARRGDQFLPEM